MKASETDFNSIICSFVRIIRSFDALLNFLGSLPCLSAKFKHTVNAHGSFFHYLV